MALAFGQGVGFFFAQESRNGFIKRMFAVVRAVVLSDGVAAGVADVFQYVFTQSPLHIGDKPCRKFVRIALADKIFLKFLFVAEQMFVQKQRQTVKLHQRVLQWCCRKQQFMAARKCVQQNLRLPAAGFIDIPQFVRLVQYHQIPA